MSLVGKTIEFLSGHDYTQDSNGEEIIKKAEIIDKFLGYETVITKVPNGTGPAMDVKKYANVEYYSLFCEGSHKTVPCQDLRIIKILE